MEITLTLAQARALYENQFKTEMPMDMAYKKAAQLVRIEVGSEKFVEQLDALTIDGTPKRVWTIYKDKEDGGPSVTVYTQDNVCIGQFLPDDAWVQGLIEDPDIIVKIKDGLDNREKTQQEIE